MHSAAPLVIGVGSEQDRHLRAVGKRCELLGAKFVIVDMARLPNSSSLSIQISAEDTFLRLASIPLRRHQGHTTVWWRRPESPTVAAAVVDPLARRFAANEWHNALNGWQDLIADRVVNAPGPCGIAHSKPLQLTVAARVGMRIPSSLVTNDESEARQFIDQIGAQGGHIALKSLAAIRGAEFPTRVLDARAEHTLEGIQWAPVILQEYVPGECDIRAVVVGDDVFAARIDSASSAYPYDYRVGIRSASISPHELPSEVAEDLVALARELRLDFGAADLRLGTDGCTYTFLEINPSGEWLFLDAETRSRITTAVARMLVGAGLPHGARKTDKPAADGTQPESPREA